MSSLPQLMTTLIRWALILAAIGALPRVTVQIAREAAKSSQLISLGAWNRRLEAGGRSSGQSRNATRDAC